MTAQIPEGGWPKIKVVGPRSAGPPLEGEVVADVTPELASELAQFYKATLVPQLACVVDGSFPALPSPPFIATCSAVIVRRGGVVVGVWVVDDESQILYPCAVLDDVAGIFRALWRETVQRFDYVWGSTSNPTIMAFAQAAVQKTRWRGTPAVTDSRIEWRAPEMGRS